MKTCEKCGMEIECGRLCQTCRKYARKGGVWHELPKYGTVEYDEAGRPICHICGMAMDKLIEHTKIKHGLCSAEYREKFGLMRQDARLTSPKYNGKMSRHAKKKPTWRKNFRDVQEGRLPRGKRNGHWSPQEIEKRRPQQSRAGKAKWKKQ